MVARLIVLILVYALEKDQNDSKHTIILCLFVGYKFTELPMTTTLSNQNVCQLICLLSNEESQRQEQKTKPNSL